MPRAHDSTSCPRTPTYNATAVAGKYNSTYWLERGWREAGAVVNRANVGGETPMLSYCPVEKTIKLLGPRLSRMRQDVTMKFGATWRLSGKGTKAPCSHRSSFFNGLAEVEMVRGGRAWSCQLCVFAVAYRTSVRPSCLSRCSNIQFNVFSYLSLTVRAQLISREHQGVVSLHRRILLSLVSDLLTSLTS